MVEKIKKRKKKEEEELVPLQSGADKIWCQVSYSIQVNRYEPFKVDIGQSISITPDDDVDQLIVSTMNKLTKMAVTHGESVRDNVDDFIEEDGD